MKTGFALALIALLATAGPTIASAGSHAPVAPSAKGEGATASSLAGVYLLDVLAASTVHRETLVALFKRQKDLPSWVKNIPRNKSYVTSPSEEVKVGGVVMQVFHACKPHDCPDNTIHILFTVDGRTAWARLYQKGKADRFFGNPTDAERAPLMHEGI